LDDTTLTSALTASVPGVELEPGAAVDQPTLIVPRERFFEVCRALRDAPALRFDLLADVTAVDWWPAEPRFEVVYHLVSTPTDRRLRLKVRLAGEDAHVPTLHKVWASACWLEREVWDLFGIVFDGHGDLRRLLMPEDWEGHPLRKDYPVQIRMTPKVYAPLQMTEQEFQAKIAADRTVRGGSGEERRR
jgi:NADH-quinone oxidoreductase subunit C